MLKVISIEEVQYTAHTLAKEWMEWDEPIPEFSSRYPNVLESCLKVPFQTFERRDLYRGFVRKAAILFYLLVKNHPFQNGNKRIAVASLLLFLYKNQKWIKASNKEIYDFAVKVAGSPAHSKSKSLDGIAKFISKHMVALKRSRAHNN